MADNNKKRSGSFRKFFPNLFFNKSKDKSKETSLKVTDNSARSNQYHDPRSVIRSDKYKFEDKETIYENLTPNRQNDNESRSIDIQSTSNHSSSSTLVSESVKSRSQNSEVTSARGYPSYSAKPQVPPKPQNEIYPSNRKICRQDMYQYPDVYYHSVEKLTDKISPLDEIEIYKASHSQANPTSVGAEIKKVSTKFLISPKKEAEVRTIQPTRARSLSFDNNKNNAQKIQNEPNANKRNPQRAYNYSAPTSPMPISHKIPSMPKTVSPYEHIRKTMMEVEEKRNNSLSRTSLRIKSTPSPGVEYNERSNSLTPNATMPKDNTSLDKERTRQKVEAFYWQKLREMKDNEDEYYLRQSLNSPLGSPINKNAYTMINCSTPNQMLVEPRSCSLPRGSDLQSYSAVNKPLNSSTFIRGAPERRTDTYLKNRTQFAEPEIIYRHPEKLNPSLSPRLIQTQTPIFHRGSLTRETNNSSQPKRVSFEEQYSESVVKSVFKPKVSNDVHKVNRLPVCAPKVNVEEMRGPPLPPVRTTSVGVKSFKVLDNRRIMHLAGHSIYSESESGSEAGEIQRILQNNINRDGETTQRITTAEVHRPPSDKMDSSRNDAAGASPEAEIPRDIGTETPRDNEAASPCDNAELMAEIPISMPEHPLPMPAAEPNEAGQSLEALSSELELDPDLLEALGESTDAAPEFGPKIHDSLTKLWLPLLTKGMTKENKDKSLKQYLIPDNCRLLQAPKINGEIFSAIPEVVRNRDKGLSFHQQQLGSGITAINRALDLLLRGDNKKEAIQHLSNGCRILSDLHATSTQTRIKLITPSLDKNFHHVIQDTERDETLFGNKLSEKIKAAKAIEKQGLQIKKTNTSKAFNSSQSPGSRPYSSGNWTAPPRRGRGGSKRGSGSRRPYPYQSTAMPPRPPAQQAATASKPRAPTT